MHRNFSETTCTLMMRLLQLSLLLWMLALPFSGSAQTKDALDKYIGQLRQDYAGERKQTGFLSAGSDFLYAQDYFETKNYSSAAGYYKDVIRKDDQNAFAHYQLAISLIRQNDPFKKEEAAPHLSTAFRLEPQLKERFSKDIPATTGAVTDSTAANPVQGSIQDSTSSISAYIQRLKQSRQEGGAETAMNTPGQQALYGIEYYEAYEVLGAETNFKLALAKDAANPYVNYLLAVSLAAQQKNTEAQMFLEKAYGIDPTLKKRFTADVESITAQWKKLEESRKVKTTPAAKVVYGGYLIFGNYTCSQTIYNGPNVNPAYRYDYKGYFELKSDGTYRWLDDGATGRYSYDPVTGNVTWLSGYFKDMAISTRYQVNNRSGQMTVSFTDTYQWECGCKK